MKVAFISDIHANLPALKAVMRLIEEHNPDRIISLGDIVGYGPYPSECVDILMTMGVVNLLGNHDAGVVGLQDLGLFREPNHSWLKWSANQLNEQQKEYLKSSPLTLSIPEIEGFAVHSSPDEPLKWQYIDSAVVGRSILSRRSERILFYGHTHKTAIIAERLGILKVQPGVRFAVNPGSVGQPREIDKRASFAIFDGKAFSWQVIKVEYDRAEVFKQFRELGVDQRTSYRLMPIMDE